MKKITIMLVAAMAMVAVQSCKSQTAKQEGFTAAQLDSVSYAVGASLGNMVKQGNFGELNYNEVHKAMTAVIKGDTTLKISIADCGKVIQEFMMKKETVAAELNKKKGEEFLAKNKTETGVVELPSGLQYKIITEGAGIKPEATDTVTVHYALSNIDGEKIESSLDNGQPATFPLNGVIKGWTEGLQLLGEGAKAMLYIPSELAYGAMAQGPKIPGNSTLVFEVELLKVVKAAPQPQTITK